MAEPTTNGAPAEHHRPSLDILICCFGTRGDVLPNISIALQLQSQSHRVRMVCDPDYTSLPESYGIDTWPLTYAMEPFLDFGNLSTARKVFAMFNGEFSRLKGMQTDMIAEFWPASVDGLTGPPRSEKSGERPFVTDMLYASMPSMVHVSLAQRLGVPLLLVGQGPRLPTKEFPHPNSKPPAADADYQPSQEYLDSWSKVEERNWKMYYQSTINKIRQGQMGLAPLSNKFWPHQFRAMDLPKPTLVSTTVLDRPADFPDRSPFLPYIFPEPPASFAPPADLVRFLDSSEPTIYVDFSSNVHNDKAGITSIILSAISNVKVRAIFRRRWWVSSSEPPENVLIIDEAPHSWLLPRISLAVHACGAGTTAVTLKTGTPSICIPFIRDQFMWSKRLIKLGAAPGMVHIPDLTVGKLTSLLEEGLNEKYRAAAKVVSEKLAGEEDGAVALVRYWDEYMVEIGGYPQSCDVFPDQKAVWSYSGSNVRISPLAAHLLTQRPAKTDYEYLELIKTMDWDQHACLTGGKEPKGRNPKLADTDIVRKRRKEQGAWDFEKFTEGKSEEEINEAVAAAVARWTDLRSERTTVYKSL